MVQRVLVVLVTLAVQSVSGWLFSSLGMIGAVRRDTRDRLHLGSGPYAVEGWTNVDYSIHVILSRMGILARLARAFRLITAIQYEAYRAGRWREVSFWDLRYPLPFSDEAYSFIYTSHVLEHLFPKYAALHLRECFRVLRAGGIMRVVVPDMHLAASQYVAATSESRMNTSDPESRWSFLGREIRLRDLPDAFVAEFLDPDPLHRLVYGHAWMYDFWSLGVRLEEAGFVEVKACRFRDGSVPDLGELDRRPDNSLHVECRKPSEVQ